MQDGARQQPRGTTVLSPRCYVSSLNPVIHRWPGNGGLPSILIGRDKPGRFGLLPGRLPPLPALLSDDAALLVPDSSLASSYHRQSRFPVASSQFPVISSRFPVLSSSFSGFGSAIPSSEVAARMWMPFVDRRHPLDPPLAGHITDFRRRLPTVLPNTEKSHS